MTTFQISICILLFVMVFTACEPEPLEMQVPQQTPHPAVISQQFSENTLAITLTRSFGATEDVKATWEDSTTLRIPTELLLKEASVELIGPAERIRLLETRNGLYVSNDLVLEEGQRYTLRIQQANSNEVVEATTRALSPAVLDSAALEALPGTSQSRLSYSFFAASDYYVVHYYTRQAASAAPRTVKDIDALARRMLTQNLNFDLYDASTASNGKISVSKTITRPQSDSLLIAITHIDQEYYTYLQQLKSACSVINRLKGEVINLKGNLKEGYGYFTLGVPDTRLVIGQ